MRLLLFVLSIFISCITFSQVDLNNGLVAYYPFNGNANDASGNGNNASFNNATLTSDFYGKPNSAYHFNGVDNYIEIPNSNSLNTSGAISICAWVKPTGFYYGPCHGNNVIMKGDNDTDSGIYFMRFDDALYTGTNCKNEIPDTIHQTYYGRGTGLSPVQDTPYAQKNIWRSVVYTYDGSHARLYIDCNLILDEVVTGLSFSNARDLFFGRLNDPTFPYWFNGDLDEVRVYNRPLNADEVKAYSFGCTNTEPCNNWAFFAGKDPGVQIGDLDISGNTITVEASFNRTDDYDPALYGGDLVSKHTDPTDVNYLLRPTRAEITTSTGYHSTPDVCAFVKDKTYHVAMTYDGSTLKFYRNGFMMSQTSCTGDMVLNNWITRIGSTAAPSDTNHTDFHGYINEVRIWNIARTQDEIRTYMNQSLPNPASQSGLLAYYTFNDLKNKQGNSGWDGSLLNDATINQTNTGCTFIADSCLKTCFLEAGFTYQQNTCDPKVIQFNNTTSNADSIWWDFGDGETVYNIQNPIHQYAVFGNYTVTLYAKTNAGCADTTVINIDVNIKKDSIIINRDTSICAGSSIQLNALSGLNYCWSPSLTLSDSSIQNPIATPTNSTTYYLNSQILGKNLVVNGDFSNGNTGFSSEYGYQPPPNINEGKYWIGTNPNVWNTGMSTCTDHTSGSGNMMLVNGAVQTNINVWKQTIAVLPNTNYAFSTWIQSVYPQNPAQLQFSINGKLIGNIFNANNNTCIWNEFYSTWNSGNSTSATISIVNMDSLKQGNDFALDDISFAEYAFNQDSVIIKVLQSPLVNAGSDISICYGTSAQLNATGAKTYNWNASIALSDTTIANPIAKPLVTTQFIVTGYDSAGVCSDKDTVKVSVLPLPVFTLNKDTSICNGTILQLNATSQNTYHYHWFPASYLSDTSIANPTSNAADTIKYFITASDSNSCRATDSVQINVVLKPIVSTISDTSICFGSSLILSTAATNANSFSWSPSAELNNGSIQSPQATPVTSATYIVTALNILCRAQDSVRLTVLSLPNVSAGNDTIICTEGIAHLHATGAINYRWYPDINLSDTIIANPFAFPSSTTTYYVKGTDNNNCINTDSVVVSKQEDPVFSINVADSSICSGKSVSLTATGGDIYKWSPSETLSDSSTATTTAHPSSTTQYSVYIYDSTCRNSATLTFAIQVKPSPDITVSKSNDIDCSNLTAQLNATGGASYSWSPSDSINNTQIPNPVVDPIADTRYLVTVTDTDKCVAQASVLVHSIIGNIGFYVANAFTPNGDGINDCFGLRYWGTPATFDMVIFDRWGMPVYHSKNIGECWDGTYKGKKQGSGVYVYMITATSICGQDKVFRKGTVVLIR